MHIGGDHSDGHECRITGHTRLDELDPLCNPDHDLKTYQGWALIEGTGTREMVPPDDPRHPRHPRPEEAGSVRRVKMLGQLHHDATVGRVRTTFTLDDDVAAVVEKLRREEGIGLSEAVNRLIRASLVAESPRHRYRHRTQPLGLKVDVIDIGGVLELLDDA